MPDRVLRDEILTSERYWSVSIEAQRFFIHLLLVVDDTGRYSGKNYTLRTACFPGQAVDPDRLEAMLEELVDRDLVRVYQVGGERFVFIPRFRQRLRYARSKYPEPPNEINDIPTEKTDLSTTKDGPKTGSGQAQVGRSEVKRSEEKRSEEKERLLRNAPVSDSLSLAERETLPALQGKKQNTTGVITTKGEAAPKSAETWAAYCAAHVRRYRVEPVRNAKVNAQLSQLVDRLGAADAPALAAWYVSHPGSIYVRAKHTVDLLLRDCEGLATEWRSGRAVTHTEARMADETAARGDVFAKLIEESQE